MNRGDVITTVKSVGLAQAAGAVGGIGQASDDWYRSLRKPAFMPPGAVFPIAWTILYTMMGVARALIVRQKGLRFGARRALAAWAVQLALNAAWPAIFFNRRRTGLAFVELLALWLSVLATLIWFFRISKAAGALLVPYLMWVSFAGVLNFSIWYKNR